MTTSWTAEQRRSMHRAGIPANVMDRLLSCFEDSAEDSKLDHFVSVEDYAENRILTSANCNAALIAAEAAAFANTDACGVAIYVPAGVYALSQTVQLRGRAGGKPAPLILGAGVGATRFEVASLPTGGTYSGAGVCFWLDGTHTTNYPFTNGGLLGCTIKMTGDHGATAVYAEHLTHSMLRDIDVIGYGAGPAYTAVTSQTGALASCSVADSNGVQTWTGLTGMTKDCEGRVLTTTGAASGVNNGTFLIVSYVSATSVKVINASGTSDGSNGALSWTEKYMSTGYRFRGDYTNSRGVTVTNNQDVRTTNLRSYGMGLGGWFESCTQWTNSHLKLENNGRNVLLGHNCDIFSITGGLFQGIGTYVVEEIPGKVGGRHVTLRDCYQEGAVTAWLKTYPPVSGVADYVLENVHQGNSTTYIDANGTRSITVTSPGGQVDPTVWAKLRNVASAKFTGAFGVFQNEPTKWNLDLYSREGFEVRGKGKPYHGSRGDQKSLNRFLIGRGDLMAEIWDAGAERLRTVNAGNLEALTGLVNGIVLGPRNAAIYPTWTASNSAFNGKPTWNNVAAAEALAGSLKATMTLGALPVGSVPGLLCVFRIPNAAYVGGGHYQFAEWADGTKRVLLGASDAAIVGVTNTKLYGYADPIGTSGAIGGTTLTSAQGAYVGAAVDHNVLSGASITYLHAQFGDTTTGTGPDFSAFANVGAGTVNWFGPAGAGLAVDRAVEIAWCGVTKRGMTQGEIEQTIDLMATTYGITRY